MGLETTGERGLEIRARRTSQIESRLVAETLRGCHARSFSARDRHPRAVQNARRCAEGPAADGGDSIATAR
ncbi:MAG TPA: hypothetical protein VHE61_06210, partial [Opitutaceae bacterium]|nr:hypothetical protein [Opitutaceae bacterium]